MRNERTGYWLKWATSLTNCNRAARIERISNIVEYCLEKLINNPLPEISGASDTGTCSGRPTIETRGLPCSYAITTCPLSPTDNHQPFDYW